MRKPVFAVVLVLLAALALHAQSTTAFVVQYVDGSVQVQLKGQAAWKTLKVKDQVPVDATLKVGKGAMIELVRDAQVVSLVKEGTFALSSIIAKVPAPASRPFATIAGKAEALAGTAGVRAATTGNATGGVRGAKVRIDNMTIFSGFASHWGLEGSFGDPIQFWEDDQLIIDSAVRALNQEDYVKCISILERQIPELMDDEWVVEGKYLLATAYSQVGSSAKAWKLLAKLETPAEHPAYRDILLRKAQVQVDTLQNEEALATLKNLLEPLSAGAFGQAACVIAFQAYKGLDRHVEAEEIRKRGIALDPGSILGRQLSELN